MSAGKARPGVIVHRDVEGFDAGALVAIGAIAGAAHAGAEETAESLHVEMDEFTRTIAFVADDRRGRGLTRSK